MINQFISTYPELAALIIGLLFAGVSALIGLWIKAITSSLEKHVSKEEHDIWPKIDKRFELLDDRMHQMELKMTRIESRLPNGEWREIQSMLRQLLLRK